MEKTMVTATSGGFSDAVYVYYDQKEIHFSVTERNGDSHTNVAVWMTPKEADDLITVLQYALSLMEDTDEVS